MEFRIRYDALQNRVVLHSLERKAFLKSLFRVFDRASPVEKQFVRVRRVLEDIRIIWSEVHPVAQRKYYRIVKLRLSKYTVCSELQSFRWGLSDVAHLLRPLQLSNLNDPIRVAQLKLPVTA
jgi:hypothetical protein